MDHTTASATGSPPFTSTSLTLGCPSTPTTATATTSICATVKTFSTNVTKTTATVAVNAKAGTSQDPVLQVKPLSQPAELSPLSRRPKGNPTVTTKTTSEADKDCNSAEDSNVGGRNNGTSSLPSPTPHPVSSSHSCRTTSSSKTTTTISGSCSSNNSTVASNLNGSLHPKVTKSIGFTKMIEEDGVGMSEQHQGYNRMMNLALERNGNRSGNLNQLPHSGECNTEVPRTGSSIQTKAGTYGGWMPVTYGKETAWRQTAGHPSMYPHQYSGRMPYQYGSPRHLQTPHMTTPQSWTPVGWPLILPHSQPHSFRNTSSSFNHTMNQALLLPQPTYSPHSNHTYNGTQPLPLSQFQPPPRNPQSMETASKTPHGKPSAAQARDHSSCATATTISSSSSSSGSNDTSGTKTTVSSKTSSPMNTPSPVVSRESCLVSHAGMGHNQASYGYANQQHMIVMPYYQYSGTVAPYYSWAAPVVMQWSVTQSPSTPMHSTPNYTSTMAAQPKHTDSCFPHTALTFTPQNESTTTTSPQVITTKFKEVHSPASNNMSYSKPGRGGHMSTNYSRNHPYYSQTFHTSPYYSSPEMVCKQQPDQKKLEQSKASFSSFPLGFSSSAHRMAMSPSKFSRPLGPGHSQAVPPQKTFCSSGGDVITAKAAGQEQSSTTVPMTPPPTPLPNIKELSDAVANLNAS